MMYASTFFAGLILQFWCLKKWKTCTNVLNMMLLISAVAALTASSEFYLSRLRMLIMMIKSILPLMMAMKLTEDDGRTTIIVEFFWVGADTFYYSTDAGAGTFTTNAECKWWRHFEDDDGRTPWPQLLCHSFEVHSAFDRLLQFTILFVSGTVLTL